LFKQEISDYPALKARSVDSRGVHVTLRRFSSHGTVIKLIDNSDLKA